MVPLTGQKYFQILDATDTMSVPVNGPNRLSSDGHMDTYFVKIESSLKRLARIPPYTSFAVETLNSLLRSEEEAAPGCLDALRRQGKLTRHSCSSRDDSRLSPGQAVSGMPRSGLLGPA